MTAKLISLKDKVRDGKLYVEQGIIAGCAGGGFENICAAADILKGKNIGADEFTLSAFTRQVLRFIWNLQRTVFLQILWKTGAVVKTAFCGPCFGAGDTPANNAFSIRHSTRNFPNREGSKIQNGQISSVALMDARSIAATAANKGFLTSAEELMEDYRIRNISSTKLFMRTVYLTARALQIQALRSSLDQTSRTGRRCLHLAENLLLKVVSEIHDPVTTTDELIPSGETSSSVPILLDLQSSLFPEKIRICWTCKEDPESRESELKQVNVRQKQFRN